MIPGSANPLLLAADAGGYSIARSLRFNSADSAYLSRTPASAGNRKTWTWAGWVKLVDFPNSVTGSTERHVFFTGSSTSQSASTYFRVVLRGDNTLGINNNTDFDLLTTRVFRDFSSWYHLVIAFDTTQSTASNRIKLYINGIQETTFSSATYPTQNTDYGVNQTAYPFYIGSEDVRRFFSGYLADIHFIDGQALTPTSFGEFDATTGVWNPKAYTGTYGTNGFHLDFADNSNNTATTLGKDSAGSNNWTPNNISVTAGAGNDSLKDSPTNGSASSGADPGGSVVGNYATLNPLDQRFTDNGTISNGNLDYSQSSTGSRTARCTVGVSSGKWYWEFTHLGGNASHGIAKSSCSLASYPGGVDADGWSWFAGGNIYNNGGSTAAYSGLTYTTNDVIGIALDLDAGTLVFYKNGVSQGTAASGLTGTWFPAFGSSSVAVVSFSANFGSRPFAYAAPSGFKSLNTANLPASTILKGSDYFDTKLYTGNGSTQTISGLAFSPDLVWIKGRSFAEYHGLFDTVRATGKVLFSNATDPENSYTASTQNLTTFNSDGFSLGTDGPLGTNRSSITYAAWCWDAGTSTVTNTQGSITSTVRANASAGFSIVTYTGTGANATVGHGCGAAPRMMLVKSRSAANGWAVYHENIGNGYELVLNGTSAVSGPSATYWNNTSPTSTVFSLGTDSWGNASGATYVAYCFAPVAGYSNAFSYSGNGSADGPMVHLGFRPRWILQKRTDAVGSWLLLDTARDTYNAAKNELFANLSIAEYTNTDEVDFLSNGFKVRCTFANLNASGGTFIGFAFAENPFSIARAR